MQCFILKLLTKSKFVPLQFFFYIHQFQNGVNKCASKSFQHLSVYEFFLRVYGYKTLFRPKYYKEFTLPMIPRVLTSVGFAPQQQIFRKKSKLVSFKNFKYKGTMMQPILKVLLSRKMLSISYSFYLFRFKMAFQSPSFRLLSQFPKRYVLLKTIYFTQISGQLD